MLSALGFLPSSSRHELEGDGRGLSVMSVMTTQAQRNARAFFFLAGGRGHVVSHVSHYFLND